MKFRAATIGDVIKGYKFAWIPTKVVDHPTQKNHIIWFEKYFEIKKYYDGYLYPFWSVYKYINYDPDRLQKLLIKSKEKYKEKNKLTKQRSNVTINKDL